MMPFVYVVLNVLFARALQDRIQSITPLTVNAANPGYCYSNLRRNFRGVMNAISFIMETCLARTSEEGGRQLVYAAVGKRNNEDDMKGAYISNTAVVEPSDFVISEEGRMMQDNVWVSVSRPRFSQLRD
jgi:retinol dehydrogenase-12